MAFRSCEMALVCQKLVSQLRNTLPNGALAAKLGFFTFWDFAAVSQLRNEGHYVAKWHSCTKNGFAVAKIFAERGLRLRNGFAAKWLFRSEVAILQRTCWDCEMVSQQSAYFAEAAKSRRPLFFPCFYTFLAPNDFSSFLLQFLLILIIQKPILHQIKLELKH